MGFIGTLGSCQKEQLTKAVYEGNDISEYAAIVRNKETKAATFEIETDSKWEIYAGSSVDNIDFSVPLTEGKGRGSYPLNVNDTARSYFQLVTSEGKAILADSQLPMAGGYNFRDLGGIQTTEGKYVKWGKIIRSDDLHNLTEQDLNYLSSIPLISIVDFRSKEEMKSAPDKVPSSVKHLYACSITPGNLNPSTIMSLSSEGDMVKKMEELNIELVTDSASIEVYKKFFALLQDEQKTPLMFHCSAGKDRTGMAAALILYALGVDDEIIMQNYLLSNIYLANKYSKYVEKYPAIKPLLEVKPEYLQSGIDWIRKDYGSVDNYLTTALKVDIPKFREMYLY